MVECWRTCRQLPSGAGYALENRLVTTRVMPDVFRASHVRRLASYFQAYRNALQRMVPVNRENPRIVVLTPGRLQRDLL